MIEVIIYKTFVMHWIHNLFCPIITTDITLLMKLGDSSYEIDDGPKTAILHGWKCWQGFALQLSCREETIKDVCIICII